MIKVATKAFMRGQRIMLYSWRDKLVSVPLLIFGVAFTALGIHLDNPQIIGGGLGFFSIYITISFLCGFRN